MVVDLQVTLRSNTTALFVFVEALGFPGWFSDNSFLALAGQDYVLTFNSRTTDPVDVAKFESSLQIRSLRDTYYEPQDSPSVATTTTTDSAVVGDDDKAAEVVEHQQHFSKLRGGVASNHHHERVSIMRPHTRAV